MLDLSLNESQEMLRETARNFFDNQCSKKLVREVEQSSTGYSPDLWRKIAALGWLGILVPEEYGGAGLDFLHIAVVMEEIGRACAPVPFLSTAVIGAATLLDAGDARQKQELLPKLVKGNLITTLALTEPSGVYDAGGVECEAALQDGNYILSGTKLFVPDVNIAACLICPARTRPGKKSGITLFLVDAKSPGIKLTPLQTIGGDKQFEILLDKVSVPQENILGKPNRGWSYLEKVLLKATAAKCVEMVGAGQQVLEMTVSYAKERKQFGHPIGSFQAIQHYCANMGTYQEGMRLIAYKAAWMVSEDHPTAAKEVAIAKAWCSEAFRNICWFGQQIHAGMGFMNDHDMPLYFRRAKAWEIAFGDADFHRETVAHEIGL